MIKERTISYKDWKTGRTITKPLKDCWPHQDIMKLVCPFDNTNLIHAYDDSSSGNYCPNCGLQYSPSNLTQERVNRECKSYLEGLQERIEKLDEKKESLVLELNHAYNKLLINKPNLSANVSLGPTVDKSRAKFKTDMKTKEFPYFVKTSHKNP
jgi:hypothetical protein